MRKQVVIYGAGHMGTAIILGLLKSAKVDLLVVEPNELRRQFLLEQHGINAVAAETAPNDSDILVLAMPPQVFRDFSNNISLRKNRTGIVISVMAGIKLATMATALGISQIVRSIPNTPSEVFQGMTVFCASAGTAKVAIGDAELVLQSFGKTVFVENEALLDPATALCGGGPAFVSFIADAMQAFACEAGFASPDASYMVAQVLRGTADLLEASGKPAMQICHEVMTPQGTTERGIMHFREMGLSQIIRNGLQASSARSKELGLLCAN